MLNPDDVMRSGFSETILERLTMPLIIVRENGNPKVRFETEGATRLLFINFEIDQKPYKYEQIEFCLNYSSVEFVPTMSVLLGLPPEREKIEKLLRAYAAKGSLTDFATQIARKDYLAEIEREPETGNFLVKRLIRWV
jgi:hypothetical protein